MKNNNNIKATNPFEEKEDSVLQSINDEYGDNEPWDYKVLSPDADDNDNEDVKITQKAPRSKPTQSIKNKAPALNLKQEVHTEEPEAKELEPLQKENDEQLRQEFESLTDRYNKATKTLHAKYRQNVVTKNKVLELVNKLKEDDLLTDDHVASFSELFKDTIADLEQESPQIVGQELPNNEITFQNKLDNSLKEYVKWHPKDKDNLEKYYHAFFSFTPLLSEKKQAEIQEYFRAEKDEGSMLQQVFEYGQEMHETLGEIVKNDEGIIECIQSLKKENKKLQNDLLRLKGMVDVNTRSRYNQNISQNNVLNNKANPFDIDNQLREIGKDY